MLRYPPCAETLMHIPSEIIQIQTGSGQNSDAPLHRAVHEVSCRAQFFAKPLLFHPSGGRVHRQPCRARHWQYTATDTIAYVAIDQNGLTATTTRTVIIEAPSTVPIAAASPSIFPSDDASTAPTTITQ